MEPLVFGAVLFAAFLHACWNALVKSGADKLATVTALTAGQGVLGLALAGFVSAPPLDFWFWASVILHVGYNGFLMLAYRVGDFTLVYPLARGSAPIVVALISVFILKEAQGALEHLAVLLICIGLISVGWARRGGFQRGPVLAALATGFFIALYTLADGLGARASGDALGYWAWVAVAQGVSLSLIAALWRRTSPVRLIRANMPIAVLGGGGSFTAYLLVIWAATQAPLAQVAALRETSILFALLVGAFFLKEPVNRRKVFGAVLIVIGAALLVLKQTI